MKRSIALAIFVFGVFSTYSQEIRKKYILPGHYKSQGEYYRTIVYCDRRDTVQVKIFYTNGDVEEGYKEVCKMKGRIYDGKNILDAWKRGWIFYDKYGRKVTQKVKCYQLI